MDLKNLLTIVIPCKNEKGIIQKTLDLLNHQKDISNVKVIVCDASNDGITRPDLLDRLEYDNNTDLFNLYV
jgi:peroxiredoxin family protein